jgi:hypothetical protein
MSVAIKYRNPRRPGEAGVVLVGKQAHVAEAKERLERRGVVVVEDKSTPPRDPP